MVNLANPSKGIGFGDNTNYIQNKGGGESHTHANTATFSGTALDFDVQYIDVIICSKN